MKINVVMPQLGESVSEGEVTAWLKPVGAVVERDEAIVEVKTDKAAIEIPAPASGVLTEILAQPGATVQVGANIAVIETSSQQAVAAVETPAPQPRLVRPPQPATPTEEVAPAAQKATETPPPPPLPKPKPPLVSPSGMTMPVGAVRMTPVARRLARELRMDPKTVKGTGAHGRVTGSDILLSAQRVAGPPPASKDVGQAPPPAKPVATPPPLGLSLSNGSAEGSSSSPNSQPRAVAPQRAVVGPPPPADVTAPALIIPIGPDDESVPLSPMRRRIAARLTHSSQTIPQVTTTAEVDMTRLAELRGAHKAEYGKEGLKLTFMPFILKAVADALKAFPYVNSSWGGDKIVLHKRIHLGVAVSVPGGLSVPVIRNAETLSVRQLTERLAQVAEHARAGKLTGNEAQGGTFTITNPGVFGAVHSTPLINPPEAAILGVCRIGEMPVVREGNIVIRQIMHLCLTYDHRIVDGETAIEFLQHVRGTLESAEFDLR